MATSFGKWRRGCGIGCGATVALSLLVMGGGSLCVMRPFRGAVATREALVERFGTDEEYTPAPDGAVAPDRMEAFLAVREAVFPLCVVMRATNADFESLDRFDGQDEVDKGEVMKAVWQAMRAAMGMGPRMGDFFLVRNEALLRAGMGLGEYSYIYAIAYGPRLRGDDRDGSVMGHAFTSRISGLLRHLLENQRDVLADAPDGETAGETRRRLDAEITRLGDDPGALPWDDGAPPAIAASLAPYRERLDDLFCDETVSLDLIRNESFAGIGIRGD